MKRSKKAKAGPKFRVGQVVYIDIDYYKRPEKKHEQFQQIVSMKPWPIKAFPGMQLTFANHDCCHEMWVRPLTARESGQRQRKGKA